ncbi:Ankyrin repeat-containing protein BDA1 [Bienertia sinuspersici]
MEAQTQTEKLELITKELYAAALNGDVSSLINLIRVDPLILDRCILEKSGLLMQSPLHVATYLGHLKFTDKLLEQKPELAEEVDQLKKWSPLHVASAKGHWQIVELLLSAKPNMCFAHDQDGWTPIHVAAVNGQIKVLEVLVQAKPQAAREQTTGGETVLHLCVKYNQLEALKSLVKITDDIELLNADDSNSSTVLHLAVATKQLEMIEFLLAHPGVEKNAINKKGMTVVDIHNKSRKDIMKDGKILKSLKIAKALPAKDALKSHMDRTWLENQRSALMVVASVIATMAFQVGINPPGGVWQDKENGNDKVGTSIWSGKAYKEVIICNTIGLISSLSVILLLISGLPCTRYLVFILRITLWIAVTATTLTYMFSVTYLTYHETDEAMKVNHPIWLTLTLVLSVWQILMLIIFLVHIVRAILKLIGWHKRQAMIRASKKLFTQSIPGSPIV